MPEKSTISTEDRSMQVAARLALPAIFVLLVLAIVYYKQRMLYADAPHILFRIMNDGQLHIEERRYGSFISQAFPWLGLRLHLPLPGLMIIYSAGFYVFYLAVALLLVYKYRNYGLAILMGLYYTLFVSDTFYWANNEVHQGTAWLMLAFAVSLNSAERQRPVWLQAILFLSLFFLAIWTHPLVMLAAVYLWFFLAADASRNPFNRIQTILFSVALIVLASIKFYQGMRHGYDSSKIEILTGFDFQSIAGIFSSAQFHFFTRNCITHYWLFTILFTAGLAGLLAKKKYLLFAWTVLFVAGYLVLTCITFRDSVSRSYMESEYGPLVIICCAPFVYYVLPRLKPKAAAGIFLLVYLVRFIYIISAATPFSNRITLMKQINERMAQKNLTKVVIPEPLPEAVRQRLITYWGAPTESLFISKLKGEDPQRTFIFLDADGIKNFHTASKDTLLGAWAKPAGAGINNRYIHIDTTATYQVVSYDSLMRQ